MIWVSMVVLRGWHLLEVKHLLEKEWYSTCLWVLLVPLTTTIKVLVTYGTVLAISLNTNDTFQDQAFWAYNFIISGFTLLGSMLRYSPNTLELTTAVIKTETTSLTGDTKINFQNWTKSLHNVQCTTKDCW